MPAPSSMTLEDAVAEVLARLGQEDDGVSNPLLASEAVRHINSAQRMLSKEYDLLAKQRKALVAVAGGQRFVDLPADAVHGDINTATWIDGIDRVPLACGIDHIARGGDPGYPSAYDLSPSTGVISVEVTAGGTGATDGQHLAVVTSGTRLDDGHDPVVNLTIAGGIVTAASILDSGAEWSSAPTLAPPDGTGTLAVTLGAVQLVELFPVPSSAGTLEVLYKAGVVRLVEDDDLLSLDDEAVIGKASVLMAAVKNLPSAKNLADFHLVYMDALRRGNTPGRTVSMSAWRRDARPVSLTGR